ncbi:cation-translocating P-type ATPase [Alloiococcus sp. CFN-8]|uniref:cation-translocating P-type ATPase n=1 Tax=Alloiococcus sp. CFN-8 TaxID=3416081 RepID=UPI003CF9FAF9
MGQVWYNSEINDVSKELQVDPSKGLSTSEVEERLSKHGHNELKEKEKETIFQKIFNQLNDFMTIILIVASIVSFAVGEGVDAVVIIAIVVVNAFLGVLQEGKAEKALEALQKMSAPNAKVLRNGKIEIVPSRDLVPGDVIVFEAGDLIPADARIIESSNLKIEEASLTGESVPAEKYANAKLQGEVGIGDRINMAYMSTVVTYGRGKAIIVETGGNTEMGKIADKIQEIDNENTPLQNKLNQLGKWLGIICIAVCVLVFVVGLLRGEEPLEMFMTSVSLAVAAIPEGLAAVVTIVLALGMKRMVSRNAIIRRLLAVETLGCVDVICSDKTGTLTQNEMTVKKIYTYGKFFEVTGQGYDPAGEFRAEGEAINPENFEDLKLFLPAGVLCNDASVEKKEDGSWGILGDPTEGAFTVAGLKAGYSREEMNAKYPRIEELPFDSERKMMSTFHSNFVSGIISFTKGAPDIVLDRCSRILVNGKAVELTKEMRQEITKANSSFANEALRVLACAYREYAALPEAITSETVEKDMIFIGLMGMIDPARPEAKDAIITCKQAGIKPVMITGDHRDTAVAIAKDLHLMEEGDGVLSGNEIDALSDEEFAKVVETTSVYARVSPENKVRIVETLRKNGHIASMTGDGVNDAMALKKADIGVAMGITGTDVAKGTADMILTDDNFASIVHAVEEGRVIYSNIRKFVFFLLSCNVGEILIVFLALLMNIPTPLLPIQLLWLNLVTDSFPALALGTEKGESDIMNQKPRKADEPILDRSMLIGIAVQSISLVGAVLGIYLWALNKFPNDIDHARTYAFVTLILAEVLRSHSSRSERDSIFKMGIFSNKTLIYATVLCFFLLGVVIYVPFMRDIFQTVPLNLFDAEMVIVFALIPLVLGELFKLVRRKFNI